jgi:putative addiction module antidote
MYQLNITQIGNSLGVILPKEILVKMNVEKGDGLFLTETPDGYGITPYNPELAEDMEIASKVMKKYRNTLKKLAE